MINHKDGLILDLRSYLEYRNGHIINSKNCNINTFLYDDRNKIFIKRDIILILNTKQNCKNIIKKLNLYGFNHVKCLKNGISGWQAVGLPVIVNL